MSKVRITKLLWFCITSLCFIFEPIRGETKTTCSLLSLRSKFFIMSSFAGNKLMWKYLICRLCLARKCVESCLVHSIPCAPCDIPQRNSFATQHIQHFMLKWVDSLRKIQDTWLQSLSSYWSLSVVGCI